jgi:DNA-binding NarL/FixJ family response regulator
MDDVEGHQFDPALRLRIVLVEDNVAVRLAVGKALRTGDLEVVAELGTGEEALSEIPVLVPDVVLLDLELPGISGLHVVRQLAPRLPSVHFVMLTVSSESEDLLAAIGAGASGYLTKDIGPEGLRRAVRGIRDGDLPMPRRMAAAALRHFASAGRAWPAEGPSARLLARLSPREREVLRLLSNGLTDREIAEALTLSPRTIGTHVGSILRKLEARNRAAAAWMFREG